MRMTLLNPRFLIVFIAVMPLAAFFVAVLTILAYAAGPLQLSGINLLLVQVPALFLICQLLASILYPFTSSKLANSKWYAELLFRLSQLEVQIAYYEHQDEALDSDNQKGNLALKEAHTYLQAAQQVLEDDRTPNWLLGIGYVNVLVYIHRAEEALITVMLFNRLVDEVLYDQQRISGLQIKNKEHLLTMLQSIGKESSSTGIKVTELDTPNLQVFTAYNRSDVHSTLRLVRRSINQFEEDQWVGLVHERNRSWILLATTMLLSYTLVGLAIAVEVPIFWLMNYLASFLIGAQMGVLRADRQDEPPGNIGNYLGISKTSFILRAIRGGWSAVSGGVIITAILVAIDYIPGVGVEWFPFTIIIASIFGLIPSFIYRNRTTTSTPNAKNSSRLIIWDRLQSLLSYRARRILFNIIWMMSFIYVLLFLIRYFTDLPIPIPFPQISNYIFFIGVICLIIIAPRTGLIDILSMSLARRKRFASPPPKSIIKTEPEWYTVINFPMDCYLREKTRLEFHLAQHIPLPNYEYSHDTYQDSTKPLATLHVIVSSESFVISPPSHDIQVFADKEVDPIFFDVTPMLSGEQTIDVEVFKEADRLSYSVVTTTVRLRSNKEDLPNQTAIQ